MFERFRRDAPIAPPPAGDAPPAPVSQPTERRREQAMDDAKTARLLGIKVELHRRCSIS